MIRYYCSGFDLNDSFGNGLGEMFKSELKGKKSIVYVPGNPAKIEKIKTKTVPSFIEHFKKVGIEFEEVNIITPDMESSIAQELVSKADFVMLMGGDPFKQKVMCEQLGLMPVFKKYEGIMLGFSAGAMLMSKHIIITPCSEEYPDFHIEEGLNFDNLSIYPHNNTATDEYPNLLVIGDETYKKADLIEVAKEYGDYYLLQDNPNEIGTTDVSIIKSTDGNIEYFTENNGKIWLASSDGISLFSPRQQKSV